MYFESVVLGINLGVVFLSRLFFFRRVVVGKDIVIECVIGGFLFWWGEEE